MTEDSTRPVLRDRFGRRIRYLRLSVTSACQLDCFYCTPRGRDGTARSATCLKSEHLIRAAEAAARVGIEKIRLTGGEPLAAPGITELVGRIRAVPGVSTVLATTNGLALETLAVPLRRAGLDGVNVSLDTLSPARFAAITGSSVLEKVLRGIDAALGSGLSVKLNAVMLRNINDDELPALARYARSHGLFVRFIERMGPVSEMARSFTRAEALEVLRADLGPLEPLEVDPEHPHVERFALEAWQMGFISPVTTNFCAGCDKLRLTSDGRLMTCLAQTRSASIADLLRDPAAQRELDASFRRAAASKSFASATCDPWGMRRIGG